MSKKNVEDLVSAIEADDNIKASDAFTAAMIDQQKNAIDSKRLDVQMNWLEKETSDSEVQ